ncbi:CocE/NonD family hydrolase [Sphingomonas sp. 3-13AW]|uniref:CocE/NonD family hydrolase n=1 Tax=Sphingomonas sp. 3-13AW TaxID=3050450 RepID=UPI003BB6FF43
MRHGTLAGLAVLLASVAAVGTARPPVQAASQQAPAARYSYQQVMVPMRDGTRLQTVIRRPLDKPGPLPILLTRSPYGVPPATAVGPQRGMEFLEQDGYILVSQNMRGRFESDGQFTMSMALQPKGGKGVDEATDAYDTVDWLVKNVPANNGRVGMMGVSYPGYAAAVALANPHPALKATSPQAAWNDWWINDDLHRYGAMRLSYATDWLYPLQNNKNGDDFKYGAYDTYEWFLKLGPVENLDKLYFKGTVPRLTQMIEHPDYDAFWKDQHWTDRLGRTSVPTLHVAGFWDQEDPLGTWKIYEKMEADDPGHNNMIVGGPWAHGTWRSTGNDMGHFEIPGTSGDDFRRDIEAPFFRHWLHGKGTKPMFEAKMFQSGSWTWKSYAKWPAPGTTPTALYLRADGSLSFDDAGGAAQCREFVSDPANPVPFRERPISPTYPSPEWRWWEAADQRFVENRPDVLSWVSAPLDRDLTVTGEVAATLMASTSGTDSDMVVKLIDVYPDDVEPTPSPAEMGNYARSLNGYRLPIAMEVRRGRWLDDWSKAKPLVSNQVRAWDVPLRDHDHVFKAGHRIMVQVQSSWFPMIDRNPQKFVPNIYKAKPEDFVKATQRVCTGSKVTLPVMR